MDVCGTVWLSACAYVTGFRMRRRHPFDRAGVFNVALFRFCYAVWVFDTHRLVLLGTTELPILYVQRMYAVGMCEGTDIIKTILT
jgi:hypothetical protein